MRRKIFIVLAVMLLSSSVVLAGMLGKDDKKNVKQPAKAPAAQPQVPSAPAISSQQQDKNALVANISNMRNQELRVAVLGQLFNEEIAKLRDVQAAFCAKYKLDVEKFRQGLYRYDDKQGKFIEITPTPSAQAPAPAKAQR